MRIVTSGDTGIVHAALYYTIDETTPAGTRGADSPDEIARPTILYYGTEIGLNHTISARDAGLEVGRMAMIWDERQDLI